MKKRLLGTLLTLTTAIAPVAAVVSCGKETVVTVDMGQRPDATTNEETIIPFAVDPMTVPTGEFVELGDTIDFEFTPIYQGKEILGGKHTRTNYKVEMNSKVLYNSSLAQRLYEARLELNKPKRIRALLPHSYANSEYRGKLVGYIINVTKITKKAGNTNHVDDLTLKNGYKAIFDFVGVSEGKQFAGGTSNNYSLTIGSHSFITGFEEKMVGMVVGEERDLNLRFPTNYGHKELAGKDVVFSVILHSMTKPAFNTSPIMIQWNTLNLTTTKKETEIKALLASGKKESGYTLMTMDEFGLDAASQKAINDMDPKIANGELKVEIRVATTWHSPSPLVAGLKLTADEYSLSAKYSSGTRMVTYNTAP